MYILYDSHRSHVAQSPKASFRESDSAKLALIGTHHSNDSIIRLQYEIRLLVSLVNNRLIPLEKLYVYVFLFMRLNSTVVPTT
jgi:hypothetical protein